MSLIRFYSPASADFVMFEAQAVTLLKMMGHSGTVPGAILAEDIPAALARLQEALAQQVPPTEEAVDEDEEKEAPVSLAHRAWPLLEMLGRAAAQECEVMWDY